MISSVELQAISRILTTESDEEINTLCSYDDSYYAVFNDQINFILDHRSKYGQVPDVFTFQAEFPDLELVKVREPISYIETELKKNKQFIILNETFNKIKDLSSGDVSVTLQYLQTQCEKAQQLDSCQPLDIVHQAKERAKTVEELSKQARIPTGFAEIDKLMYGGLSTVEELLLIVARTNTGKSWVCSKMMESAQKNGFPVLYYSPEMQGAFLATRFDTWRIHFPNSQLHQGKYDEQYWNYLEDLSKQETSAYILEDKDMTEGEVNIRGLENLVRALKIQLLIIDGLSYMSDISKSDTDYIKYKNICNGLFKLSKQYHCAVVIAMQANRETRECRDDKGDPFPNLYNVEGSDHPARICTQAFAIRQVFDKHVLDIRLEKSRNANNQKPVLSYSWDINTGNMQYLPNSDALDSPVAGGNSIAPVNISGVLSRQVSAPTTDLSDDDFDEEVEF